MRFVHTADWHLGRRLGEHSLQEDQQFLLGAQFVDIVRDLRPDAVLIAGDVFDRFVPPPDAVELLDDILHRIVDFGIPVVLIPGNHDESRRLGINARLLRGVGLHIGQSACGSAVTLHDQHGAVTVVASGYATPAHLATLPGFEGVIEHDAAFGLLCPLLHGHCPDGGRRVLVAHGFVAGGAESESERGLAVGGTGQIAAARFAGFHYTALGHLHRPQTLASGRIRYSGSPLAYSTSEAGQEKSVTLVEMDAAGTVRTEAIPLAPLRPFRLLRGSFAALRAAPQAGSGDFVAITLTDPVPVPNAQRQLGELYARIVTLDYAAPAQPVGPIEHRGRDRRTARPFDLFADFHVAMRGAALPDAACSVVIEAIAAAEAAQA